MAIHRFEERYTSKPARRVARRIDEVFVSLERVPFFRKEDKGEFRYFRRLFLAACEAVDRRIAEGSLKPWSKGEIATLAQAALDRYPRKAKMPAGKGAQKPAPRCQLLSRRQVRIGVFIGSFDPFQMTHLETALRFLARGERPADLVIVVPEGAYSSSKPGRSDYGYRYDLLERQVLDAFRPFIVPLDIGEGQDTIGIVSRIIGLFSGYPVVLTHILGSDMFPLAAKWYPADLEAWEPEAKKQLVSLDFGSFVVKRRREEDIKDEVRKCRALGIPVQVDPKPIGTPSSTALRDHGVFTIIFPTEQVIEKLEVVFRYGMHRHWLTDRGCGDYEI